LFAASILVLCQAAGSAAPRPDEVPLPVRVNHAIARGVEYLKQLQLPDGAFAGYEEDHPGGVTALVAFTLAKSGVRKNDPVIQRAWSALAGLQFKSTYSAAVHLLLCEALRDPARTEEARRSLAFLIENRSEEGVWAYPAGRIDNSNTQFALLGLRAARLLGLEVPEKVWLEALDGLSLFRGKDGGFSYATIPLPKMPTANIPYAGMTAASLASLAVLQEVAVDSARLRTALENDSRLVKEGERWLERRFDVAHNYYEDGSWKANWHHAYLWAVERWCGLTGRTRIGAHDWYAEGAARLLDTQSRDGSWDGETGPEPTCFALLFLRRATITPDDALPALEAQLDLARDAGPERFESPGRGARRLTRWWLAGPWQEDGDEPLLLDPPFDPADVKPRARGKLARRDWELAELQWGRWTDLDHLTGRKGNRQLWVLATRLAAPARSDGAALEALLWLELDDGWDVWLDGRRLSRELRRGGTEPAQTSFPLRLAPGEHLLAILVEDLKGTAAFGALLTGRDNGPPPEGLLDGPELDARKEGK
jgi:prenyltransferase beta subunit